MGGLVEDHGSLVAFEGPDDIISTQIHLLPLSPQILILPDIRHFQKKTQDATFDSHALVREVLDALAQRRKAATEFLRCSTPENKRLVFLCGGTAGAVARCLNAISRHETGGNIAKAESIFRGIITGAERPMRANATPTHSCAPRGSGSHRENDDEGVAGIAEVGFEEPTLRAMRAADALDRETASLQPREDLEQTDKSRHRSFSLPIFGGPEGIISISASSNTQSEEVFTKPLEQETGAREKHIPRYSGQGLESSKSYFALNYRLERDREDEPSPPSSSGTKEETVQSRPPLDVRLPSSPLLSPRSDMFLSPPATPDAVVYGEARVVQLQASQNEEKVTTTGSLDGILAPRTGSEGQLLGDMAALAMCSADVQVKESDISRSTLGVRRGWAVPLEVSTNLQVEQPRFVRAQQTTIRRSATVSYKPKPSSKPSSVDRGTDTSDLGESGSGREASALREPSSPSLLPVEDMVIQLVGEKPDQVLDFVIQLFKEGTYSVNAFSYSQTPLDDKDVQDTADDPPATWRRPHNEPSGPDSFSLAGTRPLRRQPKTESSGRHQEALTARRSSRPPTPAHTPPPLTSVTTGRRFLSFSIATGAAPIAIQAALRSILSVQFTLDKGYRRYQHPVMPNEPLIRHSARCWRPVSPGQPETDCRLDFIVAIGAEPGVSDRFFSDVAARVAKLALKRPNGPSRYVRVNAEFLRAVGMQAWTNHHIHTQGHDNPMQNDRLMARLIAQSLESHFDGRKIRLVVVEYILRDHPLIMELQALYGRDRFKSLGLTWRWDMAGPDPLGGVDYLLPEWGGDEMARDATSEIWKQLAAVSLFYIPEAQTPPPSVNLPPPPPAVASPAPSSIYDRTRPPTPSPSSASSLYPLQQYSPIKSNPYRTDGSAVCKSDDTNIGVGFGFGTDSSGSSNWGGSSGSISSQHRHQRGTGTELGGLKAPRVPSPLKNVHTHEGRRHLHEDAAGSIGIAITHYAPSPPSGSELGYDKTFGRGDGGRGFPRPGQEQRQEGPPMTPSPPRRSSALDGEGNDNTFGDSRASSGYGGEQHHGGHRAAPSSTRSVSSCSINFSRTISPGSGNGSGTFSQHQGSERSTQQPAASPSPSPSPPGPGGSDNQADVTYCDPDTSINISGLQPEMRRYLPLHLNQVDHGPRRQQSRKALRRLGLHEGVSGDW
ncbi:hypothetical protein NKR23_g11321 [Pleurostoma richardsiae]|uniref:Uncharacterized protein n=1 Tax=Pleurostoma richardsiae TaxID=41990 RepID=A0AA38VHD8_9PEZI|nr:hypothetical protein NKR23_g11321 [Pleurostoma richardsiae]